MRTIIHGDYKNYPPPPNTTLILADPLYGTPQVNEIIALALEREIPAIVFCSVPDLYSLEYVPEMTCFWIKTLSSKNATKHYSCFVEPILFYGVEMSAECHWSCRTGIFTDGIIRTDNNHPWKKPESMIEKLIRNHYCGSGVVYDPFAGSGTVGTVCERLGIDSYSVEIDEVWIK